MPSCLSGLVRVGCYVLSVGVGWGGVLRPVCRGWLGWGVT